MDDLMNIAINQYSYTPLANVLAAINKLIEKIEQSHQTFLDNISFCRELRRNRKQFEKDMKVALAKFHTLSEKDKVAVELEVFNLIKRLDAIAPKAIQELKEEHAFIFSWFLPREIRLTVDAFRNGQKKMEEALYPDNSIAITANPALYKKLEEAWGDLADDEY